MKILYISTVGITMGFFKNFLKELIKEGHIVDIACNKENYPPPECYYEWGCRIYQISCSRSPYNIGNIKAIREIKEIVTKNNYDIVHCHTPIAGFCARFACRKKQENGLKVFYTAHGFHFYKEAPLINWLLYYPVEKYCSKYTDVLITINNEDYEFAKKRIKARRVEYIPGVGIDVKRYKNSAVNYIAKRKELGIPNDAFLLLSVGELNKNKNHEIVIKAISKINNPKIHYIIAGDGSLKDYLSGLINNLGLSGNVHILGYKNDVDELYKTADLFCMPSLREGLPVSVMEAKASGCVCALANVRGCVDLFCPGVDELFNPSSVESCKNAIMTLKNELPERKKLIEKNDMSKYDNSCIKRQLKKIYNLY